MQHSSIIGGSSAERRSHCTGSAALEDQLPEPETSDFALEGTALHELMYAALTTDTLPKKGKDLWYEVEGQRVLLTAEDLQERFWPAYNAIYDLMEKYQVDEYDMEITYSHTQTCGPEVFGTLDFVGWTADGKTVIADFKFGRGKRVKARENYQLAFYAVGLWEAGQEFVTNDLVFAIIQPWHDTDDIVDVWDTTQAWLESYRLQERRAYLRIINDDTALKAGKWCGFCKAHAICPEQQRALESLDQSVASESIPSGMSPLRLAELLEMGERAVQTQKRLVEFATTLGEQGVQIPGYKIVESFGHRKFEDADTAERVAVQLLGTSAYERKLRSPAQLKKACAAEKIDFQPLEELITRPSRGGRLVRDEDNRPQIAPEQSRAIELPTQIGKLRR